MMKKLLVFAVMMTIVMAVGAKEVSQEMAVCKANQLMKNRISGFMGKIASVKVVTYNGRKAYMIYLVRNRTHHSLV